MTERVMPSVAMDDAEPNKRISSARSMPLWVSIALAVVAAVALTWPNASAVWTGGEFFDTDDAMRAVQLRDLLAGQSWFDMTAYRLDPPNGMFTHWSRMIDIPLAGARIVLPAISFAGRSRARRASPLSLRPIRTVVAA